MPCGGGKRDARRLPVTGQKRTHHRVTHGGHLCVEPTWEARSASSIRLAATFAPSSPFAPLASHASTVSPALSALFRPSQHPLHATQ